MIRIVSARRYRQLRQAEFRLGVLVSRVEAVRFWFREWSALDVIFRYLKNGGEDGGELGDPRTVRDEYRRRLGSKGSAKSKSTSRA
jgi:hypothetical protein